MTRMLAAAVCVVLGALLPGCSEQPKIEQRSQPGLAPGEELAHVKPVIARPQPLPTPAPPPPRSSLPSPFANPSASDPGSLTRAVEQARMATAVEPDAGASSPAASNLPSPATQATTPRDLPSELTAMLGQPADCLDLAAVASAGGRTTISLTVSVMPSGRVIRASASAPNQPATGLRCLEQRASAGKFRAPVPGAPTDITATIPIEVVAQP